MTLALLIVVGFLLLVVEAATSRRHERQLRAAGAVEPAGDVYGLMQFAYPASFAVMLAERIWRGPAPDGWLLAGLFLFACGKTLKYAAILALGARWSFRVLVVPAAPLVTHGPYRYLRHPNYVAVVAELIGFALACGAIVSGPVALLAFTLLLLRRVRVEEHALGMDVVVTTDERLTKG